MNTGSIDGPDHPNAPDAMNAPNDAPNASGALDALDALSDDPTLDARVRLDELVDRQALTELCKTFTSLFGIGARVYTSDGDLLADASLAHDVCAYVNGGPSGRRACAATVSGAKAADPGEAGDVLHPCFTGAAYRVVSIEYDGRRIGRIVLGPYVPAEAAGEGAVSVVDPELDDGKARSLLTKMPHAKAATVMRLAAHLRATLDLILFSGHKALLTGQMHLLSVRESYRELEEKNARLQEAYDRLRELDRLKSNFLATVSHELRTPLTSIIGYSEMLAEGIAGPLNTEQQDFVRTIHEKGEHLLSLIMGLLDLSKLESGTMALRRRSTQLGAVLGEVMTTVAPNARKKGVEVTLSVPAPLPELRGDPERLRQVFINLVDNAIKFTPTGGSVVMSATIESGASDEPFALLAPTRNDVEVRVCDSGIGIPERERERVFDPFYQVDSSSTREYGGTGLGLSIVKRLVEAHGGTVRIAGNEPKGTVFIVRLPVGGPSGQGSPPPP
jgi:signal transduction histidine kinase